LFSQAATGKLKVHIGQTFPLLKDAAEAQRQMENRKIAKKIVLIP